MSETPKTVFVTKYALTSGIAEREVIRFDNDGVVKVVDKRWGSNSCLYWPRDYTLTREAAADQSEAMKVKRIASLRKQIEKLERLKFS